MILGTNSVDIHASIISRSNDVVTLLKPEASEGYGIVALTVIV
jgi:hypothetical protein